MSREVVSKSVARAEMTVTLSCPGVETGPPSGRMISFPEEELCSSYDPQALALSDAGCRAEADVRGPIYTVIVNVDGVRTRAFLDFGAQISLVRRQMLPNIKVEQQWSQDECHKWNHFITQQPRGQELNP